MVEEASEEEDEIPQTQEQESQQKPQGADEVVLSEDLQWKRRGLPIWKTKHFLLTGNGRLVWKDAYDGVEEGSLSVGDIMEVILSERQQGTGSFGSQWDIVTRSRTFTLQSANSERGACWVKAIKEAIAQESSGQPEPDADGWSELCDGLMQEAQNKAGPSKSPARKTSAENEEESCLDPHGFAATLKEVQRQESAQKMRMDEERAVRLQHHMQAVQRQRSTLGALADAKTAQGQCLKDLMETFVAEPTVIVQKQLHQEIAAMLEIVTASENVREMAPPSPGGAPIFVPEEDGQQQSTVDSGFPPGGGGNPLEGTIFCSQTRARGATVI